MRHLLSTTLLLFLSLCTCGRAQLHAQEVYQLPMIARSTVDSIQLRWAPNSPELWRQLRRTGLRLTRQTVMRDGKLLPDAVRQQKTVLATISPAPVAAFEARGAADKYVAIGGQALYGESFLPQGEGDDAASLTGLLNVSREQQNRYSFGLFAADHSWAAATLMGLGYTDKQVAENETYLYRLSPAEGSLPLDSLNTAFVAVETANNAPPPPIPTPTAEFVDKAVSLDWDIELVSNYYSSYDIERSVDGVIWERVNEDPFTPVVKENTSPIATYQTDLPENNRPYFFRVNGRTPFSSKGPSSSPVQGMGKDPKPSFSPTLTGAFPNKEGGFDIGWNFPNEEKINAFVVLRSPTAEGVFEDISGRLPIDARSFRDEAPLRVNYYRVRVYDQYEREMTSFSVMVQPNDTTPPATPVNMRGVITEEGEVIINWDANAEEDLLGYRIWLANDPDDEFKLATGAPLVNNFYIGETTLNTLSSTLYAKITALDVRHNPSPFSDYIEILRPDTIAPAAPLLFNVEATEERLEIHFATSRTPDIKQHELYRRAAGEEEWEMIKTYPFPQEKEVSLHTETTLLPGKLYEYRLDAIDHTGLRSSSEVLNGQILDDFIRDAVKKVKAEPDRRGQTISLEWQYKPEREDLAYFEIYRSKTGGTPRIIDQLPYKAKGEKKPRFRFVDEGPLRMNTDYVYHVRAVYHDGALSALSPGVTVDF
ncbi:MAG: hypothetical protein AAGA31_00215 [Bacteroidota bacterium]